MKTSSIIVGDSNDDISFQHKFLLTNTQVLKLRTGFSNIHQLI